MNFCLLTLPISFPMSRLTSTTATKVQNAYIVLSVYFRVNYYIIH